jgi:phage terminase Nu1 subunit (DNA packaging protein)
LTVGWSFEALLAIRRIIDAALTTRELAKLFDATPKTIADLAKRGIIVSAGKRGRWQLQPSVTGYVRHLRSEAAARGGEAGQSARERLGQAQATLAEVKAKQLAGELVEVSEVEAKWSATCRAIRAGVLGVADRMRDLPARQHVKLATELRAALTDLADNLGRGKYERRSRTGA